MLTPRSLIHVSPSLTPPTFSLSFPRPLEWRTSSLLPHTQLRPLPCLLQLNQIELNNFQRSWRLQTWKRRTIVIYSESHALKSPLRPVSEQFLVYDSLSASIPSPTFPFPNPLNSSSSISTVITESKSNPHRFLTFSFLFNR